LIKENNIFAHSHYMTLGIRMLPPWIRRLKSIINHKLKRKRNVKAKDMDTNNHN
jgi:hypothetical protein